MGHYHFVDMRCCKFYSCDCKFMPRPQSESHICSRWNHGMRDLILYLAIWPFRIPRLLSFVSNHEFFLNTLYGLPSQGCWVIFYTYLANSHFNVGFPKRLSALYPAEPSHRHSHYPRRRSWWSKSDEQCQRVQCLSDIVTITLWQNRPKSGPVTIPKCPFSTQELSPCDNYRPVTIFDRVPR